MPTAATVDIIHSIQIGPVFCVHEDEWHDDKTSDTKLKYQ